MPAAWTAAAIGVGSAVAGSVASKLISGSGSSSGGSSGGGGGSSNGPEANGSGITPATDLAGAQAQNNIAIKTANNQSGDILTGQTQANTILDPYNTTGTAANKQQADLEGLNGPDAATAAMGKFTASPGYAYQVQQGLRGIDAGAAAKGMLSGGDTLKAEETFGSNLANQDFTNYYNRLSSLASTGLTAGQGIASTDTSAAGAQSQIANTLGIRQSNAAGVSANAVGNIIGSAGTALGGAGGAINKLFGGYSGPSAGAAGKSGYTNYTGTGAGGGSFDLNSNAPGYTNFTDNGTNTLTN